MSSRLLTCLCLLLATGAWGTAHGAKGETWLELRSANFILITNAEQEEAETLFGDLEKFRLVIDAVTNLELEDGISRPLRIYAFAQGRQLVRRMGVDETTAGFYINGAKGPLAVISLEEAEEFWELDGRRVLLHEYTHHLLHQYSPFAYPRWYDEGFAEFVSTIEFEGDRAILGKAPRDRFVTLKQVRDWLSIKEIIESNARYIGRRGPNLQRNPDRNKSGVFHQYAQGWLLTHFLINSPDYRPQLNAYLSAINQPGVEPEEAFRTAFGIDYAELDDQVRAYWFSYKLPLMAFDTSAFMTGVEWTVRALHPLEAAAVAHEASLLGNLSRLDKKAARRAFEALLEAGIRRQEMRLYLAELALSDEAYDSAETLLDQMLADDPESAPAITMKAWMMLARAKDEGTLSVETRSEIRRLCIKAIRLDPTYVPALLAFARFHLIDSVAVSDTVFTVMESIRFLEPDLETGAVLEVELLAKAGRFDEAKTRLQSLLDWASSRSAERRYEELLDKITAMEEAAPAP